MIMDNYFTKFQNSLNHQKKQISVGDLLSLIDSFHQELTKSEEYAHFLQNKLLECLHSKDVDLTSKWMELQENNALLKKENSMLKDELENIKILSLSEKEQLKQKLLEEKMTNEEQFKLEEKSLNEELQMLKENKKLKEQELHNELQVIQASTAMQIDEIESKYQQQLSDISLKQRELVNSNNNLRTELVNLKQHYSYNSSVNNEKIEDLQRQLKLKINQLKACICQDDFTNTTSTAVAAAAAATYQRNEEDFYGTNYESSALQQTKYLPLNIESRNESSLSTNFNRKKSAKLPNRIPPLIPCTTGRNNEKKSQRKRKLFDPCDFEYLEEND